jgi:hypothetical protein
LTENTLARAASFSLCRLYYQRDYMRQILILTTLLIVLTEFQARSQQYIGHEWNDDNGLPSLYLHFNEPIEPGQLAALWKKYLFRDWINTRGFEFKRMLVTDDGVILAVDGEKTKIEPAFYLVNIAEKHTVIIHNSLYSITPYSDPNKQYVKGILDGFRQHVIQHYHGKELRTLEKNLQKTQKQIPKTNKKLIAAQKRADKIKLKLDEAHKIVEALKEEDEALKTDQLASKHRIQTIISELTGGSSVRGNDEIQ